MNVYYKVHSRHKHSVRVTPAAQTDAGLLTLKLPDLYVTHDVLDYLHIDANKPFTLLVSFNNTTPRRNANDGPTNPTRDKENVTNDNEAAHN